jgi:hypothetical protein
LIRVFKWLLATTTALNIILSTPKGQLFGVDRCIDDSLSLFKMTPITYSESAQEPATSLPPSKVFVNFVKEHQLRPVGTSIRAEFPKHLVADLAWNSVDMMPDDYIYRLSDLDQMEIDDAFHLFLGKIY